MKNVLLKSLHPSLVVYKMCKIIVSLKTTCCEYGFEQSQFEVEFAYCSKGSH